MRTPPGIRKPHRQFGDVRKLDCPLIILAGRHDRSVNSYVAHEWFERVQAPSKRFVWFEHSAHEVMTEEPGKLLVTLVTHARPIAVAANDVAPEVSQYAERPQ